MTGTSNRHRVALVAGTEQAAALLALFAADELRDWHAFRADGCEHARFLIQMDACDVVLADDSGLGSDCEASLSSLTIRSDVPVLLISDNDPQRVIRALSRGVCQWLPRPLVLDSPSLLAAALQHAVGGCVQLQQAVRTGEALRDCRGQVTRLVNLLWEASPVRGRPRWYNQRTMLERLHEEVTRTERHGSPLSLVLGEVRIREDGAATVDGPLHEWTVERISRSKRAADVAGQYGPGGFMLVLPHTRPEGAATYCRRLQSLLEEAPASIALEAGRVHARLALAGHSASARTPQSLLRQAEEQLAAGTSQIH